MLTIYTKNIYEPRATFYPRVVSRIYVKPVCETMWLIKDIKIAQASVFLCQKN